MDLNNQSKNEHHHTHDCILCDMMNDTGQDVFNELAEREGLSPSERKIMARRIEDLTGLNLS